MRERESIRICLLILSSDSGTLTPIFFRVFFSHLFSSKGKFKEAAGTCADCAPGKYSDTMDLASCHSCPKGYYAKDLTTIADVTRRRYDSCQKCSIGKYGQVLRALNDNDGCLPCVAGRWSDMEAVAVTEGGADFCKACPTGKWSNALGETEESACINCETGRYSTTSASTLLSNCIECARGLYLEAVGSSLASNCQNCPAGYKQATAGSAYCLPCEPGTTQAETSSFSCKHCAVGFASAFVANVNLACDVCPIGKESKLAGSVTCQNCGAGKYGNGCIDCPQGQYRANSVASELSCTPCDAGTVNNKLGQAVCMPCCKSFIFLFFYFFIFLFLRHFL